MDKNCRFFYQCPIFECVLFFIAQALVSPITRMVSTRFPGNEKFNFDFILWKETVLNLPMCETIYCFSIQHKSCDNNLLLVCFVTECLAVTIQEVFDPHQKAFLPPPFPPFHSPLSTFSRGHISSSTGHSARLKIAFFHGNTK